MEQQPLLQVTKLKFAATTASSMVHAADSTINVASANAFPLAIASDPSTWFQITVGGTGGEIMLVTAESGPGNTKWTVTRDPTAAVDHAVNQAVQLYVGTTLNGGVNGATTTLTVNPTTVAGFPVGFPLVTVPDTQFMIKVDNEIMLVTSESSSGNASDAQWTVVRGVDGTTASTHLDKAVVTY